MRNTVRMAPVEKTPDRIAAGRALKELRSGLGYNQEQFREAINVSLRMLAAAEGGEYIGKPTKDRLEDGLGWARGDWDRFVATGDHPPVVLRVTDESAPEVVRMTPRQLALTTAAIHEVRGSRESRLFYDGAIKLRTEWAKKTQTGYKVTVEAADQDAG